MADFRNLQDVLSRLIELDRKVDEMESLLRERNAVEGMAMDMMQPGTVYLATSDPWSYRPDTSFIIENNTLVRRNIVTCSSVPISDAPPVADAATASEEEGVAA